MLFFGITTQFFTDYIIFSLIVKNTYKFRIKIGDFSIDKTEKMK